MDYIGYSGIRLWSATWETEKENQLKLRWEAGRSTASSTRPARALKNKTKEKHLNPRVQDKPEQHKTLSLFLKQEKGLKKKKRGWGD